MWGRYKRIEDKLDRLTQAVEALSKKKSTDNASYELREFLADMIEDGCGIVKIQPSSIFIRGMRD
jgi:hypothetical protein